MIPPIIEDCPDPRPVRDDPYAEVNAIKTLLDDVYKNTSDGRTLVREIVQNSDDACADRLIFLVVDQGLTCPKNPLLSGPALLAANDGPFTIRHRDGLRKAVGGSKADDPTKIGRFGIGLKSVFYICEAFVYLGAEYRREADQVHLLPGVLNPWAIPRDGRVAADPKHPDWDSVNENDLKMLHKRAKDLLGSFDNGLLLWFPLRCRRHIKDRTGIRPDCFEPNTVARWFSRSGSISLLLSQCGYLSSIEARRVKQGSDSRSLVHVSRPNFQKKKWVGRHDDDKEIKECPFEGEIGARPEQRVDLHNNEGMSWTVTGVDAVGHDGLRCLRLGKDWPIELSGGQVPLKVRAHAAITVLRRFDNNLDETTHGVRIRWAVFLPLEDDPRPTSSTHLVETVTVRRCSWDIVLHGYFLPSQDRKSITAVAESVPFVETTTPRAKWNVMMRDKLLMPLLPRSLAEAVNGVSNGDDDAWKLLEAVKNSKIVKDHFGAITSRHTLLPILDEAGVRWELKEPGTCALAIPSWTKNAPPTVRRKFMEARPNDVVFVDLDAPGIGVNHGKWPSLYIKIMLECVSCVALKNPDYLNWTAELVHYVRRQQDANMGCAGVVACWLARRVAQGALTAVTDDENRSRRAALHSAWRRLYDKLPEAWHTHEDSLTAVVELANAGKLGAGLLPIPFGRTEDRPAPELDQGLLDTALRSLGAGFTELDEHMQRSRLLLAEDLLSVRDDRDLDDLADLSLLRVRCFQRPDGRRRAVYEDWSVNRLRQEIARCRVFFARNGDAGSRQAAGELAEALGEPVWLVDCVPAAFPCVPRATPGALAKAVLAHTIRSSPAQRIPLLRRLASDDADDTRRALRVLLTGKSSVAGEAPDRDIYCVRENDPRRVANRKTLKIILGLLGEKWRELSPDLNAFIAQKLTLNLVEYLQVRNVDRLVLQDILSETLDATDANDWRRGQLKKKEVLHLLRELHGLTGWEKMPLHRCVDGMRRCFANRTVVADRLPPELEGEEIRRLSPDKKVAGLYRHLRLNRDGKLRLMLLADRPHRFVCAILSELSQGAIGERQFTPPDSSELCEFLLTKSWLPTCDDGEPGLAPEKLIDLSEDMLSTVRPLANALGNYRLPDAVSPRIWHSAKEIVHEVLGCPDRLQRFAEHLVTRIVADVDCGAYLILPCGIKVDHNLIRDALMTPLADYPGWKIVQAAKATAGRVDSAVVSLARALCGPVPARRQVEALNTLTDTPYSMDMDTPASKMYRILLRSFVNAEGFDKEVLPKIKVPTQDGDWRLPNEVTSSTFGIASCHRIAEELRDTVFPHFAGTRVGVEDMKWIIKPDRNKTASVMLCRYFEKWEGCLSNSAVGAFLSLLGNNNQLLANRWLDTVGVNISTVRRHLLGQDYPKVIVIVRGLVKGTYAINLLGQIKKMETDGDNNQIFATQPYPVHKKDVTFWHVFLRDVDPETSNRNDLVLLLQNSVEWWAENVLGICRSKVREWWKNWETGSQAQVDQVRTSIIAHLPLTLRQLGVHDYESLQTPLRNAERAQREREQAAPLREREQMEALAKERDTLQRLRAQVEVPTHSEFLRKRVREAIERSGYTAGSVLLELIQNADDALVQAAEIASRQLPPDARRVRVRVCEVKGAPTVELIHFGRPINELGGSPLSDVEGRRRYEDGRRRQWDNDLYFMMLLNLTAKPGETPQENVEPTTGRFGLGFKSVHLISDNPSVFSKDIAFSISAGLLPVDQPVPRASDPDSVAPIDGHPATRILLPLRTDVRDILERTFARFHPISALLPAFARKVHTIVVEGDEPYAGKRTFKGKPIDNAPGWSINKVTTELPRHGTWRLLRFRPGPGTEALVVGLQGGLPKRLPWEVPFLWNVVPIDEWPGCGYAINGPFKLTPGRRTHVSLNHQETSLHVVSQLGDKLGTGLVALHKALAGNNDTTNWLPIGSDKVARFMTELWKVFAFGIDDRGEPHREFLQLLHGSGRGISEWLRACGPHSMVQADPETEQTVRPPRRDDRSPIDNVSQQLARVPSSVWLSSHFFHKFQRWWDDKAVQTKVIEKYETHAWPEWLREVDGIADGLRRKSWDHWLALLVLGSCRRLGRTYDPQHRGFLELAYREGWWKVFMNPSSENEWMKVLREWQDKAVSELKYVNWMSLFPTIYQCSRYLCTYRRLLLGAGHRKRLDNIEVLLAPRADSDLTGAGVRFDAPPAPLDMGLHWVLRELVRLKIIEGKCLLPYCWVPSEGVLNFLERFGYKTRPARSSNSEKARSVSDFMKDKMKMNTENWHLNYSFDIPLHHVASDRDLRQNLGGDD